MRKLIITCVLIMLGIALCSCGESPNDTITEDATRDRLIQGKLIEDSNVDINGHHYEWVKYRMANSGVRIIGMRTKEDTLVIPAEMHGFRVSEVGGTKEDIMDANDEYADTKEYTGYEDYYQADFMKEFHVWNIDKDQILKKIILSEGIDRITNAGFIHAQADELILPESLESVNVLSVSNSHIKKTVLKGTETTLNMYAFKNSDLKEIEFPENYHGKIETGCFIESSLEKFHCPPAAKEIEYVFTSCKQLKEFTFAENQEEIVLPSLAFSECDSLRELVFPATTKIVKIMPNLYSDEQKRDGVETLVFLGKDTELQCIDYEGNKISGYLPTGKIIAPKDSLAIQTAKKSKKIASFTPIGEKLINSTSEDYNIYEDDFYNQKNAVNLVPMEYEER